MPPRQFPIAPDQRELHRLEREFRFHPADPASARTLTASQVERFNRDGFVHGLPIFDRDEASRIRDYFDRLLERVLATGHDSYSISSAHLSYGPVYDLLVDRRIVDSVSDLLGEGVVAWGSHFFCKMPGDGKSVTWHQDAAYWPFSQSHAATVWLAIDDTDMDNACMQFVAGSHLHGLIEFRESEGAENSVLGLSVDDVDRYGTIAQIELPAGQISIHNDLLLHGSPANRSDRRRCGLTLRYCAADVRAAMDWNEKGIVVRGSDRDGHWGNPLRPERELPP